MNFDKNKNLAQVGRLLIKNKITVSVAESCTSGLLQYIFSHAEEAMKFYQGGMTVYNVGQKAKQLNINPIFAEECNAVSKEIAEKMSLEIAKKFNSEMGISITGYAEPIPEDGIESSFAYISFSKNGEIMHSKRILGKTGASLADNQNIFAEKVLVELISILK